jgi:hypothetical protein
MAHTIQACDTYPNRYMYTVWSDCGDIEIGRNYPTAADARMSAEFGFRQFVNNGFKHIGPAAENDYVDIDDIMLELGL